MQSLKLVIPRSVRDFLAQTISSAGGNEVYFLGRVEWKSSRNALLSEVDVFARGNQAAAPAIIEGAEDWDLAVHNHPGGDLTPSDADIGVASELGNRQVGFLIIDNLASRLNLVVPPFQKIQQEPLDPSEMEAIFARGGALDRATARERGPQAYEVRQGQIEMSVEVTRAINENSVVALEAGTGVGKSYAYLVPAILWAVRNKRRVVISTNTIHLQEQLISKDLPFLETALPVEFRYALIKGRGNYACLRKASEVRTETGSLFDSADSVKMLGDLLDWVERTSDGSLSDLGMTPSQDVWEKLMSETDKSLKVNCQFYGRCFYYQAKRAAFTADILVVNHHLFFSDLALRKETGNYQWDLLLPAYERVVFDEAHHLEDIASRHLGIRFSREGVQNRLGRLVSSRDLKKGLLPFLARKLRQEGDALAADSLENHYIPLLPEIARNVDDHFQSIGRLTGEEAVRKEDETEVREPAGSRATASGRYAQVAAFPHPEEEVGWTPRRHQVRFGQGPDTASFRGTVVNHLREIKKELERLGSVNDRAVSALKRSSSLGEDRKASLLLDLTSLSSRLERLLQAMDFFSDFTDQDHVRWLELKERKGRPGDFSVQFASSPIRVSRDFREGVLDPLKTVVMTSATLSVEGKMDFYGNRLGLDALDEGRFRFQEYPSPFDYPNQVLTLIPTDFPDPRERSYERRIARAVLEISRTLGGRTFVLFTSYSLLRRVHDLIEKELINLGIQPLRHGEMPRSEILRRFRNRKNHVLFGTDSFWEGVDVPGDALECVMITRLPFRVPSDPVQMARIEDLERQGVPPFANYTIPQAVLRFKQGFGRLIRSSTDRGIVMVLDRRVVTKSYGKIFLRSLPPARLVTAPEREVLEELASFLRSK